jgi:hypothetical protein
MNFMKKPEEVQLKETLGLRCVLKGFERTSQTDEKTTARGLGAMDTLYATLKKIVNNRPFSKPRD